MVVHYQLFLRFGSKDGRYTKFIRGYSDLQTANDAALLVFNKVVAMSVGTEDAPEEDVCETDGTKSFSLKGNVPDDRPFGAFVFNASSGENKPLGCVPPDA
ncbi:Protein of unknown function [Pyronema omphalodes CBS 100304]|uniref:Uncharacterized protein n=1 Tax=Pyronema omphalodes (strain CBS 100304) TaxID=1076935 RepID=U4KYD2_PYROM|nr:Protein of unknown function [Pyronema omphalodes CBS 100304]